MKNRVLLKAVTITLMIGSIITIVTTVLIYRFGNYMPDLIEYHMGAGVLFLSILPIHVFMMRQKLKKLSQQLVTLAMTGDVTSSCASQLLPNALHSKTPGEFCRFLGLNVTEVREKLLKAGIVVINMEQSVEKIATYNRTDISRIFALMLQQDMPLQTNTHVFFVKPVVSGR